MFKVIDEHTMRLYDAFVSYCFVYDNIEPSLKLDGSRCNYWAVWGSCGRCCV